MSERHRLEQVRLEKLERLRRAGMDPYPNRASRSHTSAQAIQAFQQAGEDQTVQVSVAGRMRALREMGRTAFAHLEDGAGRLQLYFRSDELGEERLTLLREAIDACEKTADYISRELLEDIQEGEEAHIDWLETQLDLIARIGLQNYLQSMM